MNSKFFDLAKKVSKLSTHRNHQIGSVIVRGSKIISVGTNKYKTHPKSPHPYGSLHSEMAAILLAKQDVHGCDIYVYRETKAGVPALSRPCIYCYPFIAEAGLSRVHYSTNGSFRTEEL
jgi:deoxycytidylate deaminase